MKITEMTERKIEELLGEMTLEEKVSLCHANSKFYAGGIERMGIGELAMMDGPHGVRSETERDAWTCLNREEDRCTYLPTGTALAATFNPSLGYLFGKTLGAEARYREKDIILGPGVNIIRTPLCGRNFEYMSEDPCLIEKMSPSLVRGIEEEDVAACVKHYALNNQELDRSGTNPIVSRRALYEIYLRGFYAAIIEGGASSVMGAYNKYEGQYMCHNAYLVRDVLKKTWGFPGVYLTDWSGCHDTEEAIYNGLDLEMGTPKPYNEYYLADPFLARARESEEVRALLDDKVRRILRLMFSVGKLGRERKKGAFNTPEHQRIAYDIAKEAMVLLKNEDGVLPVEKKSLKKLLVVGPNATAKHAPGGSSSGVRAKYEVSPLEGIKKHLEGVCEVAYESGSIGFTYGQIPTQALNIIEMKAGVRAFRQTMLYKKEDGTTEEKIVYTGDAVLADTTADSYRIECSVRMPDTGRYLFRLKSSVGVEFLINGERAVMQNTQKWAANAAIQLSLDIPYDFTAGEDVSLVLLIDNPVHNAVFDFEWITPSEIEAVSGEEALLEKAASADYVIYCGGLDHSFDTEGMDKKHMCLPHAQDVLIPKLAKANPNTVVVLTAGSPVEMPWIDEVKAILWTWYAGMEGGHALADILFGEVSPSGKMPFTLPKKYEDCPVARYGEHKEGDCRYGEDIFVGYRAYDKDGIEPLYPFGHGLSYASFDYSDISVKTFSNSAEVTFTVTNTGSVFAKETAQVYIGDPVCSVVRPIKELRSFVKVALDAGESETVTLPISRMDLCFFDEARGDFVLERGEFTVFVGSSSRDIRLVENFTI